MRQLIVSTAQNHRLAVHPCGVYICTEGPRFETRAEIAMFAQWGADIVGMTGVPEVALAAELEMNYASICIVTNYAAGMTGRPLVQADVERLMAERLQSVQELLAATLDAL